MFTKLLYNRTLRRFAITQVLTLIKFATTKIFIKTEFSMLNSSSVIASSKCSYFGIYFNGPLFLYENNVIAYLKNDNISEALMKWLNKVILIVTKKKVILYVDATSATPLLMVSECWQLILKKLIRHNCNVQNAKNF